MSYEAVYKAWKREKENRALQPLSKTFYSDISSYLKNLREEQRMLDEKTIKAKLISNEIENVKQLVTDLLRLRYEKILKSQLSRLSTTAEVFTREEEAIYANVSTTTEMLDKILKDILEGRTPQLREISTEEKPKKILIRFLQAIPAIVGTDMKTYGPFKAEDVASLPVRNAEAFVKQGVAIKVEIQ